LVDDPEIHDAIRVENHVLKTVHEERDIYTHLVQMAPDGKGEALNRLIWELKGYCREVFVATDHLQRSWPYIHDLDSMIEVMYRYLYRIYPPRFATMFNKLLPDEWKARRNPKLL
jgi:hypothetical protein